MRKWTYFGAGLFGLALAIGLLVRNTETHLTRVSLDSSKQTEATVKPRDSDEKPQSEKSKSEREGFSMLSNDPADADSKLNLIAKNLTAEQLKELKAKAMNASEAGDARFIAVELISRSDVETKNQNLVEIANSEIVDHKNLTKNSEELVFRAKAIEGITSIDSLQEILNRNSNRFLVDRARRALAFLSGKSPSLKEQDEESLKKLIKIDR